MRGYGVSAPSLVALLMWRFLLLLLFFSVVVDAVVFKEVILKDLMFWQGSDAPDIFEPKWAKDWEVFRSHLITALSDAGFFDYLLDDMEGTLRVFSNVGGETGRKRDIHVVSTGGSNDSNLHTIVSLRNEAIRICQQMLQPKSAVWKRFHSNQQIAAFNNNILNTVKQLDEHLWALIILQMATTVTNQNIYG